jgi:hypothetical protein
MRIAERGLRNTRSALNAISLDLSAVQPPRSFA